jgi:hypothetical protein
VRVFDIAGLFQPNRAAVDLQREPPHPPDDHLVQLWGALLGPATATLRVGRHPRHVTADDLDQLEAEWPDDAKQPLRHVLVCDVAVAAGVALDQLTRERPGEPGQVGGFGCHGAAPSLLHLALIRA